MDNPGTHRRRIRRLPVLTVQPLRGLAIMTLAVTLAGCGPSAWRWVDQEYTVQWSDTLFSIAFRFQVDHRDLAAWNGLSPPYTVRRGQRLRLSPPPGFSRNAAATPSSSVRKGSSSSRSRAPAPAPASTRGPSVAIGKWQWPARGDVVRGFSLGQGRKGIDIAGQVGTPVRSAAAGKVVYSGSALKGYGKLLIIKHNDDYLSAYGFNRKLLVSEGASVTAGQVIAEMGLGPANQALLHFEIRERGKPVDPLTRLPAS